MKRKITIEIISSLLILLFAYAAISKLLDYTNFSVYLGRSPVFAPMASQIAWLIPGIELIAAGMLLFSKTRLNGLYLSLILMVAFTAYLFIILNFSLKVPCTCGGILQGLTWKTHIIFNLFFVAISIIGIVIEKRSRSTDNFEDNDYELRYSQ